MTIEQTVEVTENGILHLELPLPPDIPVGARVNVTVTPEFNSVFPTHYKNTRKVIERCHGLGKRMGSRLSSEMVIEMRHQDKKLEEMKYQQLYGRDKNKN